MQIAREPRRKVLIRGRMYANGPPTDVCIRDISATGLMLQAPAPPARGTYVEIIANDHPLVGRVVWTNARRFGVRTSERLNVSAIVLRISPPQSPSGTVARAARPARALARPSAGSSRALGRAMEFVLIGGCAAALAAALIGAVYSSLADPMDAVSAQLGGPK